MTTMNLFDMSDTWNSAGTTFTAIKMNVTDTASASGSLLMDLQVGGASQFKIRKDGLTIVSGFMNTAGFRSTSDGGFYITDSTSPGVGGNDIALVRDAANTLALRNGLNSQTFRIYQTFTSVSQNAYLNFRWSGTDCRIQTTSSGAESAGTLTFGTSGVEAWRINASNHLVAVTDNTYDIGASGANRPRNVFVAGYVAPSNLRIEDNAGANGVRLYRAGTGILTLYNTAETDFNRLQFGGTTNAFPSLKRSGSSFQVRLADDTGYAMLDAGEFRIRDDVVLNRDAANTLAQRNGTNAQTFRVYSTYTDASNNRRAEFGTDGNGPFVQSIGVGTGNGANFSVLAQAALFLGSNGAATWQINTSGHFLAATDNTYDIGANGANRPRNVFWAGYQEMSEMTAPAAPATNNVRIYAEDNGSGKTRLMARFATGAAVQIAIEP